MMDGLIGPLIGIPVVLLLMLSLVALISFACHKLSAWAGDWPTFARRFPTSGRVAGGEEWLVPERVCIKLSPDPWRDVPQTLHVRGAGGHALSANCPVDLLIQK